MNQLSWRDPKAYYDEHVHEKLRGFIEGNPRVECAWNTIRRWAPDHPTKILEIGCGIGEICWRMSKLWPASQVSGLDISPKSLEIACQLFGAPQLSFVEGALTQETFAHQFDLIILMDVYEHIAVAERPTLHNALRSLCSEQGRIVLSFPTPRHLAYLRVQHPDQIQPVDENISFETIRELATDLAIEILLYQEVSVWHEGDYAHAVLGQRTEWRPVKNAQIRGIASLQKHLSLGRARRKRLVQHKLKPIYRTYDSKD